MDFFVLCHICLIGEVIEITCISLRVQLRHKWRFLVPQLIKIHLREVFMTVDLIDVLETLLFCGYKTSDEVPGTLRQKIIRIFILRLAQDFLPSLKILPGFIDRGACKWR